MLNQIKMINFKGHADLELKDLKQINQIVGENGAGKTSIAKALQFVFSGSSRDRLYVREGCSEALVSAVWQGEGRCIEFSH